ncbi:MAG: hypothetical protein E7574_03625 [Ruminococcaceae bacterium]|nr:hypothetical protein [Oscillospiraceae bacterium]
MFGYVKPESRELKVKEYELYKSAYCGLCRVMGKRYSYLYKMSLSYDFVFMVLLRLYAMPENVSFSQKRCIAHPLKKKTMMNCNSALETASDVGVIMLYHDFVDKIKDKDGIKSFVCRLTMPELRRLRKKACKDEIIKEFDAFVENKLCELSDIEKENTKSIDMAAENFGSILAEALSIGFEGDIKRTTYEIGRNIGKWIYIIDALDDIDSDEKNQNYNPFIAVFGSAEEAKKHGDMIKTALLNTLSASDRALAILNNTDAGVSNILTNIIRLGNVDTVEKILKNNKFAITEA